MYFKSFLIGVMLSTYSLNSFANGKVDQTLKHGKIQTCYDVYADIADYKMKNRYKVGDAFSWISNEALVGSIFTGGSVELILGGISGAFGFLALKSYAAAELSQEQRAKYLYDNGQQFIKKIVDGTTGVSYQEVKSVLRDGFESGDFCKNGEKKLLNPYQIKKYVKGEFEYNAKLKRVVRRDRRKAKRVNLSKKSFLKCSAKVVRSDEQNKAENEQFIVDSMLKYRKVHKDNVEVNMLAHKCKKYLEFLNGDSNEIPNIDLSEYSYSENEIDEMNVVVSKLKRKDYYECGYGGAYTSATIIGGFGVGAGLGVCKNFDGRMFPIANIMGSKNFGLEFAVGVYVNSSRLNAEGQMVKRGDDNFVSTTFGLFEVGNRLEYFALGSFGFAFKDNYVKFVQAGPEIQRHKNLHKAIVRSEVKKDK